MLHIRNKWTRLMAIIMLVGFVVTAGPIQALEELESYSVYTTLLTSLEASAGTWNKGFRAEETNGYVLTLGPEEPEFRLTATSAEADPNACPTIIIDGKTVKQGSPSQAIGLEMGEKKEIAVEVQAKRGGGTQTYQVTAYRTDFQSILRARVGEPLDEAGRRLVQVDYYVPAGTVFKALELRLSFDPNELQLAKKDGTVPARLTVGTLVSAADCLKASLRGVEGEFDNEAGSFRLGFGKSDESDGNCEVSDGTLPVVSTYFVLAPNAGLSSLKLTYASVALADVDLAPQYPGLVREEGFTCELRLPRESTAGGQVVAYPAGPYYYGEKVTIMAQPAENYTFAGWNDKQVRQSFEVTLRGDTDLSALAAEFVSQAKDETTPLGYGIDNTGPEYDGEVILVYAPDSGISTVSETVSDGFYIRSEINGLTEIEPVQDVLLTPPETVALAQADNTVAVGDSQTFSMRDIRKDGTSEDGWTAGEFKLAAECESEGRKLRLWLSTDETRGCRLTEEQIETLSQGFANNYAYLAQHLNPVRDSNGNGALDILMYDIYDPYTDGGSSYTGGFVNGNEFFGALGTETYPFGNYGDVIHLDTYPQLNMGVDQVITTMAHETQHLCMQTAFETMADYQNGQPPTWINEGLSMTVEHALFGPLASRVYTFNHSSAIRNGLSLTDWGGTVSNYALSYLFFQYVGNQTGDEDFAKAFYRSYDSADAAAKVLQSFECFQGKDPDRIIRDFYVSLWVREETGAYAFPDEGMLAAVNPQCVEAVPQTLPANAAVYVTNGDTLTLPANGLEYVGLTAPESPRAYTLAVSADESLGSVKLLTTDGTELTNPAEVNPGTTVTLTAEAKEWAAFDGWYQGDTLMAAEAIRSIEMPASPVSLTARFTLNETVSAGGMVTTDSEPEHVEGGLRWTMTGGSVKMTPDPGAPAMVNGSLPLGTPVMLTAVAAEGYTFRQWNKTTQQHMRASEEDLTNPSIQTHIGAAETYTPVFEASTPIPAPEPPEEATPAESLRLAQVILTEPNQRGLLPRVEDSAVGFDSLVNEYDLYLLSNEGTVGLQAVCKSAEGGVKAELFHMRGEERIGTNQTVTNYAGDDFLVTLAVEDVRDGDELRIRVFNDAGEENIYRIHIHRTSEAEDPAGSVTFRSDADGYTRMSIVLKNVTANAVTLELPFAKDALTFYDREKQPLAESRPEKWSLLEDSDYEIVAAEVKDSEDDADMSVLELTVALKENAEPTAITLQTVAELYCKVRDSAGEVWHGDTAHAELYDMDRIYLALDFPVETGSGQAVTGSFFAYKAEDYVSDGAFRVYLTADGGAEIAAESVAAGEPDTQGLYEFTYTFKGVGAGTYTLVVNKPGHTPLELSNIQVGAEAYTVAAKPTLTVGDVDGDGWVRTRDKGLLTQHYGAAGESGDAVFDLDGDGWVRTRDLSLLMPNLGKGTLKIIEEVNTDET